MDWYFLNDGKYIEPMVKNLKDKLVIATINIYNTVKSSKELLPTPAKSHYVYNLRDLAKVFYGIGKVKHFSCPDDSSMVKLWAHEVKRVF